MKEETQEEIVRYRDLQKIKTEEEYKAALERLEYYKREYTWMQETKEPLKEVKKELEALLPMFNCEKTESQRYFLRCINLLNAKSKQIENGEYLPNLKRNITALVVTTKQYEQRQEEYSVLQILVGILKRDKKILEALRIDNLFERTLITGNIPAEKDLSLQEPAYLAKYISDHYNLVGIEVPEYKQNLALVPVNSEGKITPEQEFVSKMVTEYLEESRQNVPHVPKHKGHEKSILSKEEKQSEQEKSTRENLERDSISKDEKQVEYKDLEREYIDRSILSNKDKNQKNLDEGEINQ